MNLKEHIKQQAYELGADLVGFGNIERCKHAPPMMSPQGLFPGAKTVIVMAVHHPDVAIELGGDTHSQEIGPYSVQYLMNSRLDEMSYRMATFIEKNGYDAVPIASSNIWRYNRYKDLKAVFAPDVSHIYMAVVAGLSEIGYNGISLTPEFGARNRFITVITDAVLEPDPLIPPGTVCDKCMLCRKECPAQALNKEIDGDKVLKIDQYEYRFPNKNLWRCSWGEHFDLDLDLDLPEKVDEEVIKEYVATYGIRSGEMGQCLKFCVPANRRSWDKGYSRTPLRDNDISLDESLESRARIDRILSQAYADGAEYIVVADVGDLAAQGVDLETQLPGAKSAVTVIITDPVAADSAEPVGNEAAAKKDSDNRSIVGFAAGYIADSVCYDITRGIENLGFRSVMTVKKSGSHPDETGGENITGAVLKTLPNIEILKKAGFSANTVITRKTIPPRPLALPEESAAFPGRVASGITVKHTRTDAGDAALSTTRLLGEYAKSVGADLFGVSPVERIDSIFSRVSEFFDGREHLTAKDVSQRFTPWEPEVTVEKVAVRKPEDHLDGAKSVIVIGLRYHGEVLRRATKPPAEAVGPYVFQTYATDWMGRVYALRIMKKLQEMGYRAAATMDLMGTASFTANPRGPRPDLFSNRFAAVCAGLGWLVTSGHVATPAFGLNQRFIAIVTDAELESSPLLDPAVHDGLCARCGDKCITACPSSAIQVRKLRLPIDGVEYAFHDIDRNRCDWVKRYALMKESGFGYLGSSLDVAPGDTIDSDSLADALKRHDPIKKYRPVVAEPCVLVCPYAVGEGD